MGLSQVLLSCISLYKVQIGRSTTDRPHGWLSNPASSTSAAYFATGTALLLQCANVPHHRSMLN